MCQGTVVSDVSVESGNTKPTRNRSRGWIIVWNNYNDDDYDCLRSFVSEKQSWILGKEIGESGTPHIQGYFYDPKQTDFSTLKKKFPKVHWEKAAGSPKDNYKYCSKAGKHETNMKFRRPVKDPIVSYRPWQSDLNCILETESDDRTIHWYWEPDGKLGKTTFAKSYCIRNPNTALYLGGKAADMKTCIVKFLENESNDLRVVFMDFTRSRESYISYEGIEEIKNGIFFSSKYESTMCIFNSPHVVCFANYEPTRSALSEDRWNVKKIDNV